jgi:uncharacterized protein GlcG (DUF336 family)
VVIGSLRQAAFAALGAVFLASGTAAQEALTAAEVEQVIAQAVHEARARSRAATVAVVDRVGNVLGVFRMTGATTNVRLLDNPNGANTGLSGFNGPNTPLQTPTLTLDTAAAIAKAVTGAYLSSSGNAFSTRTASQIVQEHFNPGERFSPGGPLFGVQFSQLPCSDLNRRQSDGTVGPKRSPLGLSADPGGLPLYKNGAVVGGVGAIADGLYGYDINIRNTDTDDDELIAIAGATGFDAPVDIRANRITVDGKTLRYTDRSASALASTPAGAASFAAINGTLGVLVAVPGYAGAAVTAGQAYGAAASGYRVDTAGLFAPVNAVILVDAANAPRFAPRAGTEGATALSANEVQVLLRNALQVATRARADPAATRQLRSSHGLGGRFQRRDPGSGAHGRRTDLRHRRILAESALGHVLLPCQRGQRPCGDAGQFAEHVDCRVCRGRAQFCGGVGTHGAVRDNGSRHRKFGSAFLSGWHRRRRQRAAQPAVRPMVAILNRSSA